MFRIGMICYLLGMLVFRAEYRVVENYKGEKASLLLKAALSAAIAVSVASFMYGVYLLFWIHWWLPLTVFVLTGIVVAIFEGNGTKKKERS